MSKAGWQIDSRLLDPKDEPVRACFDFGSHKTLDDGKLRFELIIRTSVGDITFRGFRYDPDTDQLLLPSYRAGQGWQQYVRLDGPILDGLRQKAKELGQELAEAEPVEGEILEARH
jgi:hypothetical protein